MEQLTKFQVWTLFKLFDKRGTAYDRTNLLLECCDSAIVDLEIDVVDLELDQLVSKRYIYETGSMSTYKIDDGGILYVRKLLAAANNNIPIIIKQQNVIAKQEEEIRKELNNKEIKLQTFLHAGIKNIGSIIALIHVFL